MESETNESLVNNQKSQNMGVLTPYSRKRTKQEQTKWKSRRK